MNSKKSLEPLKITALLRNGIICDEYLPLDGILLYQAMRQLYGARDRSLPGGETETLADGYKLTPIKKFYYGQDKHGQNQWYYSCSFACPQPWWISEGQDHWNKRVDESLISLTDHRSRIDTKSGRYRAYHMPVFYRTAQQVSWYCVGDLLRIAELLGHVTHLGKKVAQGWGRVIEWKVEKIIEDFSRWKDGTPTRALPLNGKPWEGKKMVYGVKPPYYVAQNQTLCAVP